MEAWELLPDVVFVFLKWPSQLQPAFFFSSLICSAFYKVITITDIRESHGRSHLLTQVVHVELYEVLVHSRCITCSRWPSSCVVKQLVVSTGKHFTANGTHKICIWTLLVLLSHTTQNPTSKDLNYPLNTTALEQLFCLAPGQPVTVTGIWLPRDSFTCPGYFIARYLYLSLYISIDLRACVRAFNCCDLH